MSVAASTRRERIRNTDGSRTDLPGGGPSTGLSAIAACATGVATLSGAARAAVYGDAPVPHAEVTLGVESFRDVPAAQSWTLSAPAVPGYTLASTPLTGSAALSGRRDNAGWAVMMLDTASATLDAGGQLGPGPADTEDVAARPFVWLPTTPLARLVANPEADPAGAAWALTGAPTDQNDIPNPSFETNLTGWTAGGGTLSRVTSGGSAGSAFARVTVGGSPSFVQLTSSSFGVLAPGDRESVRAMVKGTVGTPVRLSLIAVSATSTTTLASVTGTLTGTFAALLLENVQNTTGKAVTLRVEVASTAAVAAAGTLDVDAVKARPGATAGAYVDGASTNGVWTGTPHTSPSYVQTVPAGAYTRPVDGTAPALGLPGASVWVHRRTGALAAGQRVSSTWGDSRYALMPDRSVTVAGWVGCTLPSGGLAPVLRWVVELLDVNDLTTYGGRVLRLTSAPFAPPSGGYRRVAHTLTLPGGVPVPEFARPVKVRVHLEVVDPRNGTPAGTTLSLRGVHLYAGTDRGDAAGLLAVPVLDDVTVKATAAGTPYPFEVSRVDVHGNDRLGMVTSARVTLRQGVSTYSEWTGASPGRLTVRGAPVRNVNDVVVHIEETNTGPGGPIVVQTVQAWHEVDATLDVAALAVERATDADPADSTVPIGNYAASSLALTLDDPDGEYAIFARSYLELGHRVDVATGFAYTNRSPDPQAVDAFAAGVAGTEAWPVVLAGTSPVAACQADSFGQLPPALYGGSSLASAIYDAPQHTTAPAGEGWVVRASVWVRWDGPTRPTIRFAGAFEAPMVGGGWSVALASGGNVADLSARAAGVWWLVDLGSLTVPVGANVVTIAASSSVSDSTRVQVAAPTFERLDPATLAVVEVVETAPAGVFETTSWDSNLPGQTVNVQAVDVLAAAGDGDLSQDIVRNTTAELEITSLAREYLDLGADQVVIANQVTSLSYLFPVDRVSTQLADLAKVAVLTAFTDGLGRLVALPRQDVAGTVQAAIRDDLSLIAAGTAVTPDVVRNDVRVTVHPVTASAGAVELAYAGREVLPALPWAYEPDPADIVLNPGESVEVLLEHAPADGEVWSYAWRAIAFPVGTVLTMFETAPAAGFDIRVDAYATFARMSASLSSSATNPVRIFRVSGTGRPLTVADTTQRFTRQESIDAFGRRPVAVDVRLAQSPALARAVATDVLDNYSLRDDTGERWLPDLSVTMLGDPWRELGDRVMVRDVDGGLGGEFRVVSHRYGYGVGAESALYLRRTPTGLDWFVLDESMLDDGEALT